jgi:replicative DNA helicase
MSHATYSQEAEQAVLGCLSLGSSHNSEVLAILQPEDFYLPAHSLIFSAAKRLHAAGFRTDFVSLQAELQKTGQLEEAGGADWLDICMNAVPHAGGALTYAGLVKEKALARKYEDILSEGIGLISSQMPIADVVGLIQVSLGSLASRMPARTKAATGRLGDFEDCPRRGVSTGYMRLDTLIGSVGGYPSSQMTIVSAYHKTGKTAFKLHSAIEAAKAGRKPLFATFADMDGRELQERMMKHETGWARPPYEHHHREEWDLVREEFRSGEHQIDVYDAAGLESGYDVETFLAWFDAKQRRDPNTEVYVDYAQELQTRDKKSHTDQDVARICSSLIQRSAKRHDVPFIVGSQITEGRDGERDKTKGSRAWEEKAGLVIRLKKTGDVATLHIPFSRVGLCGDNARLDLHWNQDRVRFEE